MNERWFQLEPGGEFISQTALQQQLNDEMQRRDEAVQKALHVYEKYKHLDLDHLLSDREWLPESFQGSLLYDMWQVVKAIKEAYDVE